MELDAAVRSSGKKAREIPTTHFITLDSSEDDGNADDPSVRIDGNDFVKTDCGNETM